MQSHVLAFLHGYLNARGNAGSEVTLFDDLAVVRYRVPMGRASELFYWGTEGQQLPLEAGMWLTVIGTEAAASLPALPASMQKLADEYLMEADLPLTAQSAADVEVVEISGSQAVAAFNQSELFAAIPSDQADRRRAAFFRADHQGEPAAAGRFGWARAF
jgi:hypothetical protein